MPGLTNLRMAVRAFRRLSVDYLAARMAAGAVLHVEIQGHDQCCNAAHHNEAGHVKWRIPHQYDDRHDANCEPNRIDVFHGTVPQILQRRASGCNMTPQNEHTLGRIINDQISRNNPGINSNSGNQCPTAHAKATAKNAKKQADLRIIAIVSRKGFMPWTCN